MPANRPSGPFSEVSAYRFIQARSMNSRRSMRAVATAILKANASLFGRRNIEADYLLDGFER